MVEDHRSARAHGRGRAFGALRFVATLLTQDIRLVLIGHRPPFGLELMAER